MTMTRHTKAAAALLPLVSSAYLPPLGWRSPASPISLSSPSTAATGGFGGGPNVFCPDRHRTSSLASTLINEEVELSSMTVAALRDACRESGLPVSGTKAVLIERLMAVEDATAPTATVSVVDSEDNDDNGIELSAMTVAALKDACREAGLLVGGNKAMLIKRLTAALEAEEKDAEAAAAEEEAAVAAEKDEASANNCVDLSAMTVMELKNMCRYLGVPVSGTKAVLVERLEAVAAATQGVFEEITPTVDATGAEAAISTEKEDDDKDSMGNIVGGLGVLTSFAFDALSQSVESSMAEVAAEAKRSAALRAEREAAEQAAYEARARETEELKARMEAKAKEEEMMRETERKERREQQAREEMERQRLAEEEAVRVARAIEEQERRVARVVKEWDRVGKERAERERAARDELKHTRLVAVRKTPSPPQPPPPTIKKKNLADVMFNVAKAFVSELAAQTSKPK